MATHSSSLAWKIPRVEKPGGLQPTRSQRAHNSTQTDRVFGKMGTGRLSPQARDGVQGSIWHTGGPHDMQVAFFSKFFI